MKQGIILLRQLSPDNILICGIARGDLKSLYNAKKNEDVVLKCNYVTFDSILHTNTKEVSGWLIEDVLKEGQLIKIISKTENEGEL